MSWSSDTIHWVAGIIEGEGSFGLKNRARAHPSIKVAMTDEDIIRRLHTETGIGRVNGPYLDGGRSKPIWHWTVTTKRDTARLMLAAYPVLGTRRQGKVREIVAAVHWPMYERDPR